MKKNIIISFIGLMLFALLPSTSKSQDAMLGEVRIFAGNFAPRGWALCQGQLLAISQNQALFSILGTTYGGDGRTTFALPDLRGRAPLGQGQGPGLANTRLGEKTGSENITLTQNNLPSHTHGLDNLYELPISIKGPGNKDAADTKVLVLGAISGASAASANTKTTGGSQPFRIEQPSLGVNYIIALQGIFPSRN